MGANGNTATATIRAGIYCRISDDRLQDTHGVRNQEKACRELAKRLEWPVVEVYVDDDLSAFSGKPRPAYRRLMADIVGGRVTGVLAWQQDRLQRSMRELEDFVDLVQKTGCEVATVQTGDVDLTTYDGRMVARILGSVARRESEHKSARLKLKHKQLAGDGKDGGGGRPFGYEQDRQHIRPKEAALIRDAAARVVSGEPLRSVMRDWNKRGIKSVTGKEWSVKVLKSMLVSARISGRREYGTDQQGNRLLIGPIIATATWPAIIPVEQSDRLRARLTDPARKLGKGEPHKYLLTGGLAVCGIDGAKMQARPKQHWKKGNPSIPSLVCSKIPGHLRIESGPLEQLVSGAVLARAEGGALIRALRGSGEDRKAVDELAGVEQKMAGLAEDWASDRLTRGEWERARKTLVGRQDALRHRVEASRRQVGLDGLPDPLRSAWPSLELHRRRAVISLLVEAVVIARGISGLNRFDSRRVTIKWKA